jgi:hypothetical protein
MHSATARIMQKACLLASWYISECCKCGWGRAASTAHRMSSRDRWASRATTNAARAAAALPFVCSRVFLPYRRLVAITSRCVRERPRRASVPHQLQHPPSASPFSRPSETGQKYEITKVVLQKDRQVGGGPIGAGRRPQRSKARELLFAEFCSPKTASRTYLGIEISDWTVERGAGKPFERAIFC